MQTDILMPREQNQISLIIHADDIGMYHLVNKTTIEAHGKGVESSGSFTVPFPRFAETDAYFRNHPEFDVGSQHILKQKLNKR